MSNGIKINSGDSGGYSPGSTWKAQKLAKIDVNNEEDLLKWEAALHMHRFELLDAIKAFGPVVRDIRRGLLMQNQDDEAA